MAWVYLDRKIEDRREEKMGEKISAIVKTLCNSCGMASDSFIQEKTLQVGLLVNMFQSTPGTAPDKVSASKQAENCPKTLFVKINMDGIPIGRKVDLKAYDSYQKLSYAVDEHSEAFFSAQSDSSVDRITDKESGRTPIGGILNGCGEYTLVYEDNEGDRMLVGDVPWDMFVVTAKRLRVLKSSELPTLSRGSKQGSLYLATPIK